MTTPVRQLKDEDGNTFYPQTVKAAIPDYGVKTADIEGGAVTLAKIDSNLASLLPKCISTGTLASNGAYNGGVEIPMTESETLGSGITVSGGRFVIGSGISNVLVFASWTCAPEASGFRRVDVRKGTSSKGYAFTTTDVSTGYLNGAVSGVLIPVTSGDTINLYNRETKMTFWTGTRMAVIGF